MSGELSAPPFGVILIPGLIGDGMADKQIARRLGISGHTVREHPRRACAKMNTSKRSALVAMLFSHGVVFGGNART